MPIFNRKPPKVVTILAVIVVILWGVNRAFGSLFYGMCGGTIYSSTKSPDGNTTAYAFERGCGATTGFASFIVLRPTSAKLDLSEDLNTSEIIFQADGDFKPTLKWISKNQLEVTFGAGSDVPRQYDIWEQRLIASGTRIIYKGL